MDIHTPPHSGITHAKKIYKIPKNTENITNSGCQVTKLGKLALFAQYCYSDSGSFEANHLHIERLKQKPSSRVTGDQRDKQLFPRLTAPFGLAATAALAGISLMATPLPANAQDNDNFHQTAAASAVTKAPICTQVVGYPRLNCATPGLEKPMNQADILANPALYKNRVVLHFGEGVMDVGLLAKALNVPAYAIPGGPKGGVHLIIDGHTGPPDREPHLYTQDDVYGGVLGGKAERYYARMMEIKAKRQARVQTASATPMP